MQIQFVSSSTRNTYSLQFVSVKFQQGIHQKVPVKTHLIIGQPFLFSLCLFLRRDQVENRYMHLYEFIHMSAHWKVIRHWLPDLAPFTANFGSHLWSRVSDPGVTHVLLDNSDPENLVIRRSSSPDQSKVTDHPVTDHCADKNTHNLLNRNFYFWLINPPLGVVY